MKEVFIYLISDGNCESIERITKLALLNFDVEKQKVMSFPYVKNEKDLNQILSTIHHGSVIIHSFVNRDLLYKTKEFTNNKLIDEFDALNPLIEIFEKKCNENPKRHEELNHLMDKEYFERISAIEFAVKYDDGNNYNGIHEADIVIVGVSRTSKTPLSIYMANENKVKVANIPLVPEIKVPKELFDISPKKLIGLTNSIERLNQIRLERLKTIGISENQNYTSIERIIKELEFAEKVMKKFSCPIIDVSNKSIEETATIIMSIFNKRNVNENLEDV